MFDNLSETRAEFFASLSFGQKLGLGKDLFISRGLTLLAALIGLGAISCLGLLVIGGVAGLLVSLVSSVLGETIAAVLGGLLYFVFMFFIMIFFQMFTFGQSALVLTYIEDEPPQSVFGLLVKPWQSHLRTPLIKTCLIWVVVVFGVQMLSILLNLIPILGALVSMVLSVLFSLFACSFNFLVADRGVCRENPAPAVATISEAYYLVTRNLSPWLTVFFFNMAILLPGMLMMISPMVALIAAVSAETFSMANFPWFWVVCCVAYFVVVAIYVLFLFGLTYKQIKSRQDLIEAGNF